MSMLRSSQRSMRIIALPLTTAIRSPNHGLSHSHLTYYYFDMPPPREEKGRDWAKWVTTKAADVWAGFGKADEGSWKRKVFLYGERVVDRIDFEELALKSFDPSLGPKIMNFGRSDAQNEESEKGQPTIIPLIYPSLACSSPLDDLRGLLKKRKPRHRKGFYIWMLIAPLTMPIAIVPLVPNLPFFFCVWRSWSHYRAYKASAYLEDLLKRGAIHPQGSKELDEVYRKYSPHHSPSDAASVTSSSSQDSAVSSETLASDASAAPTPDQTEKFDTAPRKLILTREAVPAITNLFGLPSDSSFATDAYRALEQARLRISKNDIS